MATLFARTKEKAAKEAPSPKKKATTWSVGDPNGDVVGKSIKELVKIDAEMKALEAKAGIHKQVVQKFAHDRFVDDFASAGVLPDTPMRVVNSDGDTVTYVVQDRSGQYQVKDTQIEDLKNILGADVVPSLIYTETTFSFNRDVMAIPGVSEVVEKALEAAIKKLVKDEIISENVAENLLSVSEKTAFKSGILSRASSLTGNDVIRLDAMLDALGSSCCRYVKT